MTFFQIETEVNASAQLVWKIMRDVEHWPEWTPTRKEYPPSDAAPIGDRELRHHPTAQTSSCIVARGGTDDLHRSFTWVNTAPGVRIFAHHSVMTLGDKSRIRLSLRFEGLLASILAFTTRKLNNRYLQMEAHGLKSRVERNGAGRGGEFDRVFLTAG